MSNDTVGESDEAADVGGTGGDLSVAHDVRNQIAIVLGYIDLCLEAESNDRMPNREHLQGIMNAATKAADLLRNGPRP